MIRRVSFKATGFAVLSAGFVLILLACAKPVSYNGTRGPGEGGDESGWFIEYKVDDQSPKLQWSVDGDTGPWTDLESSSIPDDFSILYINVTEPENYTDLTWYCNGTTGLTAAQGVGGADNETLTITPGTDPFEEAKTYQVYVLGTIDEKRYGTSVFIKVAI